MVKKSNNHQNMPIKQQSKKEILIISEDAVTTIKYFQWFSSFLKRMDRDAYFNLHYEQENNGKAPITLMNSIVKNIKSDKYSKYDIIYCICDRDKHKYLKSIINDIALNSKYTMLYFIISYPSIEYWFIIHLKDCTTPYMQPIQSSCGKTAKDQWKKLSELNDEKFKEYYKEFFDKQFNIHNIQNAIQTAYKQFLQITHNQNSVNPSTLMFIPIYQLLQYSTIKNTLISIPDVSTNYQKYLTEFTKYLK